MPTYTPDQVDLIVEHRLERLRDTWKQERADLWAERDGLRQQVAELEAELAAFRRRDVGTGTLLHPPE